MFHNNHDGTFTEQALETGVALSDDGMVQAGMGLGVGDIRMDGNLHIVKTHFAGDTPAVYFNDGKGNFRDATLPSGLAVETRFVTWGVGVADLDNDGNADIFAVTGGIYPEVRENYNTPRVVFRNLGKGRFEELLEQAGPGVSALHSSRGCAFGDFDNDGDVDVVIVNHNEPPSLLRNDVDGAYHWLKIKLTGVQSNRSAIGARVTVRYGDKIQVQEVLSQSSYLSVNDSRLHFGLGPATVADIEIRWPLGRIERLAKVAADQLIWVKEGSGISRAERFATPETMRYTAACFRALLAIACASFAMAQKPAVETAWQLVAQGKQDQAVKLLRDVIKGDPRNADARLLLGSLLMEGGQRAESIAQLGEAVRLLPKSAEAHNALGEAYNTFGEISKARPEFERAVGLDPRHAQAHVNLAAFCCSRAKRSAQSRTWIRRSGYTGGGPTRRKLTTCGPKSTLRIATRRRQLPNCSIAVELAPDFAEAWSDLGEARKNLSDSKGALAAFRRSVELIPDNPLRRPAWAPICWTPARSTKPWSISMRRFASIRKTSRRSMHSNARCGRMARRNARRRQRSSSRN